MVYYIIFRLLSMIPVALCVIIIVASLINFVPGDPVLKLLGDFGTLEEQIKLREQLGLNLSLPQQIFQYLTHLLHGDFGSSLMNNTPVLDLITERLMPTFELAICALIFAICFGLPLGILSAIYRNTMIDHFASFFALFGAAIPNFWLGPILILFFSVYLGWLPVSERTDSWQCYVLPAITLGSGMAAILSRIMRNSLLETLSQDYIRTARAKGLGWGTIIFKHAMRNALLPVLTILGLQFGVLMTGAVITERIFDWPGLGSLILEGISSRDYPVIQGCILWFSWSYLIVNLLTDIAYKLVDPRIKL